MKYNSDKHNRHSIRLKNYDYSQAGAYFVSICVQNRECVFGNIVDGEMHLNKWGEIIAEEWMRSSEIRKEIKLDEFVVMPNHIHGIVMITEASVGATGRSPLPKGPPAKSIGSFVAGFKSAATKRINEIRTNRGAPLWQRNYYEHVIRNEEELKQIREYITGNPIKWTEDDENPDKKKW